MLAVPFSRACSPARIKARPHGIVPIGERHGDGTEFAMFAVRRERDVDPLGDDARNGLGILAGGAWEWCTWAAFGMHPAACAAPQPSPRHSRAGCPAAGRMPPSPRALPGGGGEGGEAEEQGGMLRPAAARCRRMWTESQRGDSNPRPFAYKADALPG